MRPQSAAERSPMSQNTISFILSCVTASKDDTKAQTKAPTTTPDSKKVSTGRRPLRCARRYTQYIVTRAPTKANSGLPTCGAAMPDDTPSTTDSAAPSAAPDEVPTI